MVESQPHLTPLRRQPKQQRSQKRVEQILRSAAEVFTEVGYEAATTHMIAARAKTAIGSLYQFFPDKLAIFHALEARHMENVLALNRNCCSLWIDNDHLPSSLIAWWRHTLPIFKTRFRA
jgi:AcrR family transcriptional regulator